MFSKKWTLLSLCVAGALLMVAAYKELAEEEDEDLEEI